VLSDTRAVLLVAISGVLWGSSFVVIKAGLEYVDVVWFAFLRMLLASVLGLAGIRVLSGTPSASLLRDRSLWFLGVSSGAAFVLQNIALLYTTAGKTSLLVNLNVIGVAMLSWRVHGERFGTHGILALALGSVGLVLLTTNGDLSALATGQTLGDLLALITAVIWAFFTIISKQVVSRAGVVVSHVSTLILAMTAVTLTPIALLSEPAQIARIEPFGWLLIVYTALFCTTIPYFLWNLGLTKLSATNSALILLIEILVASVGGFIFFHESLGFVAAVGAFLIVAAIILTTRRSRLPE
jgi:drug/metabolite transporter (DMT)-like permease